MKAKHCYKQTYHIEQTKEVYNELRRNTFTFFWFQPYSPKNLTWKTYMHVLGSLLILPVLSERVKGIFSTQVWGLLLVKCSDVHLWANCSLSWMPLRASVESILMLIGPLWVPMRCSHSVIKLSNTSLKRSPVGRKCCHHCTHIINQQEYYCYCHYYTIIILPFGVYC